MIYIHNTGSKCDMKLLVPPLHNHEVLENIIICCSKALYLIKKVGYDQDGCATMWWQWVIECLLICEEWQCGSKVMNLYGFQICFEMLIQWDNQRINWITPSTSNLPNHPQWHNDHHSGVVTEPHTLQDAIETNKQAYKLSLSTTFPFLMKI